ncbi:MAG: peptidase [Candidatus Tokpelaia sp. JSC188]|nr:MAG: peptidase [Candidatus Tokpelaia sp. JSC188]
MAIPAGRVVLSLCLIVLSTGKHLGFAISSSLADTVDSAVNGRLLITNKALLDIQQHIALSHKRVATLADEIGNLKKDQQTLGRELINAAKAKREFGQYIRISEGRLKVLVAKKHNLKKVLELYRGKFAEVLVGLERIGLNPPPAILVRADNALQSVRSAVLLGSVVQEMQARTDTLAADLKELEAITKSVKAEQLRLANAVENQQIEEKRLSLLLAEKAKLQQQSEKDFIVEKEYNRELAEKAKSLQDLLAEIIHRSELLTDKTNSRLLQIQTDFFAMRGLLSLPVKGHCVQTFSKTAQGELIETEPTAVVTSPVEGIVRYAGIFRSYGQLLIIDLGHNYHLILAGLGRIDVVQGQMLLEGEPVGIMGTQFIADSTAFNIGKSAPMLYIEIRKDGKPINPAPWWLQR